MVKQMKRCNVVVLSEAGTRIPLSSASRPVPEFFFFFLMHVTRRDKPYKVETKG